MNTTQLNIFDQPAPAAPQTVTSNPTLSLGDRTAPAQHLSSADGFSPGVRIRIIQASPPLEHLNGRLGEVVSVMPGFASVNVEGIAVAMVLSLEAIEKYSDVNQYIDAHENATDPIIAGSIVECDRAFLGLSGVVRRVEPFGRFTIAWVDYGNGKPLYPSPVERLRLQ